MAVFTGLYVGAKTCTAGPSAGAKEFMAWFLGAYSGVGGKNLGIYNCRPVRGGLTTSLHGEGRAVDFGCPIGNPWMQALVDQLVAHSAELGIQCIIYNRQIWSSAQPAAGWRKYTGVASHTDHAHIELTWASARTLTVAHISAILGGRKPAPSPVVVASQAVIATQRALNFVPKLGEVDGIWGGQTERGVNTIREAINGRFPYGVKEAQTRVGVAADGAWGPRSKAALKQTIRELQAAWGARVDGQWGPNTEARWKANKAAYFRG